jgi:drug/metabolite transporter (DMT)-like permease
MCRQRRSDRRRQWNVYPGVGIYSTPFLLVQQLEALMSWAALGLVLISAVLHAAWNYVAKSAADSLTFLWGVCVWTPVISLLVCIGAWLFFGEPVDVTTWKLALLGGFFQGIYVALMGAGYNRGDLSVVYPIARGLAPLIIAVIAWIALNERPSIIGILAMCAVLVGAALVTAGMWTHEADGETGGGTSALLPAVAAAVTIAIYHVIDKAGAQGANVVSYLLMMQVVLVVVLTPFVLKRRRLSDLLRTLRTNLGSIALCATLLYTAYALVVAAMMFEDVAYVAAARNISIVFGIILGVARLQEGRAGIRIVAGVLIFAGIIGLALGG